MGQRVRSRQRRAEGESGERVRPSTAADDVLALQRTAGNQAVNAMLARDVAQPADAKAPAATGRRAVLPGIGTIALLSASLDVKRLGGGRKVEDETKDIVLTSRQGRHTAELMKASRDGTQMTVEVWVTDEVKIVLEGAIVGSYSVGAGEDPAETWTLNFAKMTLVPAGEKQPGEPRSDSL